MQRQEKEAAMEAEGINGGKGAKHASKRLSEFMTDEVLGVLQEAAGDEEVWKEAIRGPREFLNARGIETPDDVEVMLYERAVPGRYVSATAVEPYCEPPLVAQWVPAVIKECAKKVVVAGPREYDPDLGGFVHRGTFEVCLIWSVRYENRWYCALPQLTAVP
jgi:hypothetical protein